MTEIDESVFNPDPALCRHYDLCEQMPIGPNDDRTHIGLSPISCSCRWDERKECHFVVRRTSQWSAELGEPTTHRIPDFHEERDTTYQEVAALLPIVKDVHSRRTDEGKPDDCNGDVCYACRAVALEKAAQLPNTAADSAARHLMQVLHALDDNNPATQSEAASLLAALPAELSETATLLRRLLLLNLETRDG